MATKVALQSSPQASRGHFLPHLSNLSGGFASRNLGWAGLESSKCRLLRNSGHAGFRRNFRRASAVKCIAMHEHIAQSAAATPPPTLPDVTDATNRVLEAASALHSVGPADLANATWNLAVGVGLPCTVMECGDHFHRSTLDVDDSLKVTVGGILLVLSVVTYLWSTPGVAPGFWDMFILAPLERRFRPKLKKEDLVLGKKLGEGGYGAVYKGELKDDSGTQVVVKRASDFGAVEIWMNERVRRVCPKACATFISGFVERNKYSEEFWLVFAYEGDSTLARVIEQKDFPYNVERIVLKKDPSPNEPRSAKREMRVIRRIFREVLGHLQKLHATGIVHRDVKPQNMIFNSETGACKIIDLGAAADLRVGINFNPNEYLLDPRYAAPEQYIMSSQTPRAPAPPIAAALSPVLWQLNLPDRFDMYSAGLIFLQMCMPPLRNDSGLIQFNRQLKRCNYDLSVWRESMEKRGSPEYVKGFELLDLNGGLGWQLVQALMRFKARQRISADVALLHPFFDPGAPTLLQRLRLDLLRLVYRDNTGVQRQFVNFMARSGSPDVGGFTEMSLQKFRRDERKKLKNTWDRNAAAAVLKMQKKVSVTINSTFGGEKENDPKRDAWWNRWQARQSVDSKA